MDSTTSIGMRGLQAIIGRAFEDFHIIDDLDIRKVITRNGVCIVTRKNDIQTNVYMAASCDITNASTEAGIGRIKLAYFLHSYQHF